MAEKMIRFGIVGPGSIANKFADAVSRCDDAEIVAVASRSAARGAAFAEKHGIATVYDNYQALMEDPEVDAIYVSVPHTGHAEFATMAMRHKKAVLCEKPCGVNLAQVQQLVAVAKEENVLFMEALWTRFLPAIAKAHEWIAQGKIGDVRLVESSFSFQCDPNPESRLYRRDLAGGAMLDVGVYITAFALDFGQSELKKLSGMASVGAAGVDEISTVQMQFENDVLAYGSCGIASKTPHRGAIYGTKGSVRFDEFWGARDVQLYNNEEALCAVYHDEQPNGFYHEVKHFAALWREGAVESPRMPWSESLRVAGVYDGLLKEWGIAYE